MLLITLVLDIFFLLFFFSFLDSLDSRFYFLSLIGDGDDDDDDLMKWECELT